MILDLNGIELNASNYLLAKPFWKQTTKDISMEINYKRYFEVNESLEAIDKYWRCLLYTSDAADDWLVV